MAQCASLLIKHMGGQVAANTCVGGQCLYGSGLCASPKEAVSRAADRRFDYQSVLVSADFTRSLSLDQAYPDILYIQIHSTPAGEGEPGMPLRHESRLTDHVTNFLLRYDFRSGLVNIGELLAFIEASRPRYIAINTPYTISEYHVEDTLFDRLSETYPDIVIYPSRHLMNRDFITRGNTLLLNLLLWPEIARYTAGIRKALGACGVDCPVFFLRNSGMVGEYSLAFTGMDCLQSEALCLLYDVLALYPYDDMYIADWASEALYFVHQGRPQMIRMPLDYRDVKIYAHIPVRYSLKDVVSCPQLLALLSAHNPLPGPVPLISLGDAPFEIHRLFEYPVKRMAHDGMIYQCGMFRVPYRLEIEAYERGLSTAEIERRISQTLSGLAVRDGIPASTAHLEIERLPLKYMSSDKYIVRGTLTADLGGIHG